MATAQTAKLRGKVFDTSGEPVPGTVIRVAQQTTICDGEGVYELVLTPGTYWVIARSIGHRQDSIRIDIQANENLIRNFRLKLENEILTGVDVIDERSREDSKIDIDARMLEFQSGPNTGVEGLIKTLPGVVSNSELSSQYSVRGGNFDENLVYVNGIEIYRPFLARAGQQEGLSFVKS